MSFACSLQGYGRAPPGAAELSRQTGGQWTMASNRGPGAIQYQSSGASGSTAAHSGSVGGSWASTPSVMITHSNPSSAIANGTHNHNPVKVVSDGTYERSLILELCPPGGMKPVPPPDKLANFRRSVPSLNADLVCPILLDLLEEGQPWVIRAKVLCVMETCVEASLNSSDGSNPYRDFLYTCRDEILPLASHNRAPIREPAQRLLSLIGVEFDKGDRVQHATRPSPAAAPAPNLLDFDNDSAGDVPAPTAPPPILPSSPSPQPPLSAPTNGSLFGGMQMKSPDATIATEKIAATPANGNLLDLMGDNTSPAPQATQSAAVIPQDVFRPSHDASSMFNQLSINDEDKKSDSFDTAMASSGIGGSAFGFINQDSATVKSEAPPVFDPLLSKSDSANAGIPSFSPRTQQKILAMSPEQMQAMAYQQMMMQQQMQQMQMAAYMQQQQHLRASGSNAMGGVPMMGPMFMGAGAPGLMSPPTMMPPGSLRVSGNASTSFSFMDNVNAAKKDDKKFDFVKDAMKTAK
jgi:hypothetical protein